MNRFSTQQTQHGAVLIVSLIILLVLTILGVVSMQNTTLEERMAGNTRDQQLAFDAAEAALRAGEQQLQAPNLPAFDGSGYYYQQDNSLWTKATTWSTTGSYGVYDAKSLTAFGNLLSANPEYYLEQMPSTSGAGGSSEAGVAYDVGVYRVTARGIGGSPNAVVILQSTFRR